MAPASAARALGSTVKEKAAHKERPNKSKRMSVAVYPGPDLGATANIGPGSQDHPRPRRIQPCPATDWRAREAAMFVEALHGSTNGFAHFLSINGRGRAYSHHVHGPDASWYARTVIDMTGHQCVSMNAYRFPRGPFAGISAIYVDLVLCQS